MTHLKKAKITGRGVDMTEKIAVLLDDDANNHERVGFLQVRLGDPETRYKAKKVPRSTDADRALRFDDCPPDVQEGFKGSRHAEWQKWMKFNAACVVSKDELHGPLDAGGKLSPIHI